MASPSLPSPPYNPQHSPANRSRLSAGRGASASLPRFDPYGFSATHPSGVKTPQRPHTLFEKTALERAIPFRTARKDVTVARLWPEKKERGRGVLCGASIGVQDVYLLQCGVLLKSRK
jgi:hypothetical protein